MSKEADLSSLENGLTKAIENYSNVPMPDDVSKLQAIQILTREVKLVSDEKKRIFDQENQKERFELEKDHRYWSEKFEEKKFQEEHELAKKRLDLDLEKSNALLKIETTKLELEKDRLECEKNNSIQLERNRKDDLKFKYISLGLTIGIPMLTTFISLMVYRKLAYTNLKLIYVDEGRPTMDYKDAVKSVKNLVK